MSDEALGLVLGASCVFVGFSIRRGRGALSSTAMDDRRPLILTAALALVGCVEDTSLLPLPSWCDKPQQVEYAESFDVWAFDVELGELCPGSWTAAQAHTDWVAALWGEREDFGYAIYDSG
ncbi:MAG: hypothetical protein KC431_30075, partial [Myxococcales bacterium]|nr:hypothetical protein [Myxococcales bacterium]